MAVISITRLRVRRWWYLPQFIFESLRTAKRASRAEGNLSVALLRDRRQTFWTRTSWTSEAAIKKYMHTAPHGPVMRKLLDWCDEASLVRWTQDSEELPSWSEAHRRLQQNGRPSKVHHPTPAHTAHQIAPPAPNAASSQIK